MPLDVEIHDSVAVLCLNRPEARNAIDPELTEQIEAALDRYEEDPAVSAVVVTGAGHESFCAGVDLKVQAAEGVDRVITDRGGFAGLIERSFSKPLIAAVNGYALGGGFEIVLACDLVVAAEHATLASTEVKWGQLADGGALIRLPNRIPLAIAAELVLVGEPIDARRAADLGLVNRVVAAEELLDEAIALGRKIGENSPRAVALSKALLLEALGRPEVEAWPINNRFAELIHTEEDWKEGPLAFIDKRAPRWST